MRGDDNQQEGMFSYVSPERRVPAEPERLFRSLLLQIFYSVRRERMLIEQL